MTIRAVDKDGKTIPQYEGKILFKIIDRTSTDYSLPKIAGSTTDGYQFTLADEGSHKFTN